jgi:hypothetical protein
MSTVARAISLLTVDHMCKGAPFRDGRNVAMTISGESCSIELTQRGKGSVGCFDERFVTNVGEDPNIDVRQPGREHPTSRDHHGVSRSVQDTDVTSNSVKGFS